MHSRKSCDDKFETLSQSSLPWICKAINVYVIEYTHLKRESYDSSRIELANKPLRLFELRKFTAVCAATFFSLATYSPINLGRQLATFYLIRHPFDIHSLFFVCSNIGKRSILRFVQLNGNQRNYLVLIERKRSRNIWEKRANSSPLFCLFLVGN